MKQTTSTWRRATIALAFGALTVGAALPAAAAPSAPAPVGNESPSVTGTEARAAGIARAGLVNAFKPAPGGGDFTTQGLAWK